MAEWKSVSFEDGVDTKITTHAAIAAAHHTKYTDAEVDAIVLTHKNIAGAHHTKYTDAEVDAIVLTHKNIAAAHHSKYTDAEAVSAVDTGDDYVKNTGDTIETGGNLTLANGLLTIRRDVALDTSIAEILCNVTSTQGYIRFENKYGAGAFIPAIVFKTHGITGFGGLFVGRESAVHDVYNGIRAALIFQGERPSASLLHSNVLMVRNYATPLLTVEHDGKLNLENNKIKNPKNLAASALSGTKKVIEIDIGGTPYYFEVYPTKA